MSARLAVTFPNPNAIPKGDRLVVHLDKQAPREPVATAGATSRLLFLGGSVHWVRDETLRASEYFTLDELSKQTIQSPEFFGGVVSKELVDNALDACEGENVCHRS